MSRHDDVMIRHRAAIKELAAQNKAERISLFGSVARGEDGADSDIDFLAKFTADASLLDLSRLRLALRDLLDAEVDVVSEGGLRGRSLRILDEAVPL